PPDCLFQDTKYNVMLLLATASVRPSGERARHRMHSFVLMVWAFLPVAVSQKLIVLSVLPSRVMRMRPSGENSGQVPSNSRSRRLPVATSQRRTTPDEGPSAVQKTSASNLPSGEKASCSSTQPLPQSRRRSSLPVAASQRQMLLRDLL